MAEVVNMPLIPFNAQEIVVKKTKYSERQLFSNGKKDIAIKAWEVYSSRKKIRTSYVSKVYNDETRLILRTHDKLALQITPDDELTYDGYAYSVQDIAQAKTPISLSSTLYEIQLK